MVRTADVVVVVVGRTDWLQPGAVVIDVGINSVDVVEPLKARR